MPIASAGTPSCHPMSRAARFASISTCSTMPPLAARRRSLQRPSRRPIRQRVGRRSAVVLRSSATRPTTIDVEHGVIVDVEATTAVRRAEVTAAKRMIERTEDRFGLWPEKLTADTGYGSAEMLGWLVHEKGIEPHVPVFDKSARTDGTFSRDEFRYDAKRDIVRCPGGKPMHTSGTPVNGGTTLLYRASKYDCSDCALKPRCCPKEPQRRVPRSI